MIGEIITEHRERMLNLKKYYPFFKLIDTSFSQFKEGRYEALDLSAASDVYKRQHLIWDIS